MAYPAIKIDSIVVVRLFMKNSTNELSVMLEVVLRELQDVIGVDQSELITPEVVSAYLFRYIPQHFYANQIPLSSLSINPISNGYQVIINQTVTQNWLLN